MLFIVMDYGGENDLRKVLDSRRPLKEGEVRSFMVQMVSQRARARGSGFSPLILAFDSLSTHSACRAAAHPLAALHSPRHQGRQHPHSTRAQAAQRTLRPPPHLRFWAQPHWIAYREQCRRRRNEW